jgi:hypothetical protein
VIIRREPPGELCGDESRHAGGCQTGHGIYSQPCKLRPSILVSVVSEKLPLRRFQPAGFLVENSPELSTDVEDTPTISRVLAMSETIDIVIEPQ